MASKYVNNYPIPNGLADLLRDFSSAVLEQQPDNIYDFGAAYFKALDEGTEF